MRAINLIPAEEREGSGSITGRSGGAALLVLTLIGGLALLAFLYGSAQHKISSSHSELASVETELSAARAQVQRLTPYTSFISMADQRAQEISQLVASRFDWSHAFNELGRVVPHTAVLTTLHGQVGSSAGGSGSSSTAPAAGAAATASSSTPPGSTPSFQLSGCATTQSEVANTLQRLRLIDGAAEVSLQTSAKASSSAGTGSPGQAAGSAGPCPKGSPTFSATVTFNPLPTPTPAPSAAAIVPTPVSAPPAQPRSPRRITVATKPGGSR
jgi:hypothetical protein